MHSSIDIRKVKCLEGLHYSFELLGYNYSTMYQSCLEIKETKDVIPALSKCWAFVDLVHRIREIAQAIPGLSKKSVELKCFLEETSIAEEYRHYIQHLRRELGKKDINNFPVWGSLGWVDDVDELVSHMVVIGTQIPGTSYSSCVYDLKNKEWVSEVCLGVDGKSFNFDPIYDSCVTFNKFISPWIHETYEPGIEVTKDYPIITMKIQ